MTSNAQTLSPNDLIVRPEADLEDLIPDFVNNRRADMAQIQEAMNKQDYVFIKRLGHTLKGIARPYGFVYLEALSKRLEGAGEAEDISQVQALFDEMTYYFDNIKIIYQTN